MSVLPQISDPLRHYSSGQLMEMAARKGLKSFMRRMFPGYRGGAHIDLLIQELEKAATTPDYRLIVVMPPRHSKSLHVSEGFPAWYLGRYPDNRVILGSHTSSLAETFSRRVRGKLLDDKWPFPRVALALDKQSVKSWDIEGRAGGLFAVGVGGSPTGHGANMLIIDDPIKNAEMAASKVEKDALWEWYTGTIRTRLQPGGSIVITATRWVEDDLTGRLLDAMKEGTGEQWVVLHLPAVSEEGEPLWPQMWSLASLLATQVAVGSKVWSAQYQGSPKPAEGGLLRREYWSRYTELPPIIKAEILLDSAFKTGVHNDWSAFSLWARSELGQPYLLKVWRKKVEFPDLIRMAYRVYHEAVELLEGYLGAEVRVVLVIEDKASGQSAIQTLRNPMDRPGAVPLPRLPVIAYPVSPSMSKIARVEGVSGIIEAGSAFIPESAPWLEEWLHEHELFPNGTHDDQVDTTAMAIERLGKPRKEVDIR